MPQLDKSDIEEIESLKSKFSVVVSEAGQTSLQINLIESDLKELKSKLDEQSVKFKKLITEEQELIKRLSDKYGAGQINFDTGEFTPER